MRAAAAYSRAIRRPPSPSSTTTDPTRLLPAKPSTSDYAWLLPVLAEGGDEDGLDGVEAVFGLFEHDAGF
jgi:hypothetical protein